MGLIHVYNSFDDTHETLHANGKIKDVLAGKYNNAVILKEGNRLDDNYEIKDNDVLFIRKYPQGTTTLITVGVITSVIALGVGVGSAIYANRKSQEQLEAYEKAQQAAEEKAGRITQLPFLKGSKNQTALGRTIPYIMGSMYFTPYLLNSGYYSIGGTDGKEQYWNALLVCGYNNQKLQSVSIGNTKIKDFDQSALDQQGVYNISHSTYGDITLEVINNGEMYADGLNQKVVGEVYGEEIKHEFGMEAEPLIKQLPENAKRVEVCLEFDGLRAYSDNGWTTRDVEITPYWSNNADSSNPTWHEFYFKVNSTSYEWQTVSFNTQAFEDLVSAGLITVSSQRIQTGRSSYTDVETYASASDKVTCKCNDLLTHDWTIKQQVAVTTESNRVVRNTNETIRFIATHDFTASESYGKNISIKLVRTNPKLEDGSAQETAILQYINTFCYDAVKSDSSILYPCKPIEQPYRDQTLRLGLKIKANENTLNIIDEINVMTTGTARVFENSALTTDKQPTRNPVAWVYDILTSDYHKASKYSADELKTQSFLTAYNYCETNNYYCDYVVTAGEKKQDLLEKILGSIGASLIIGSDGLLEIAIDKAENTPVALLNSQSIKSITYAKTFERELTGLKTTYTNRNSWAIATEYFMRDGSTTYDQDTDRLGELALETVTTHEHAYKLAQRQQRQAILQPRTINVEVGLEGELYPLYSTILLQVEQLKQGLNSSVIHEVIETEGIITGVKIADRVEFLDGFRYGVIIQAQNDNGRQLLYREVTGEGLTDVLTFTQGIAPSEIQPSVFNQLSFGLLTDDGEFEKITNTMKIYGITPGENRGWTLELKDYNPDIYEVGTIPEYKSNLTTRPTTQISLPVVTKNDVNAVIQEANNYTRVTAEGLSARIDNIVTDVAVLGADKQSVIYDLDGDGKVITTTTTSINIHLRQGDMDLDFIVGSIDLPSGFTYTLEGKTLKLTVLEGTKIKTNTITIPVFYRSIVSVEQYADENGEIYVDENGTPYGDITYSTTATEFPLYFTYFGSSGGIFSGSYDNEENLPTNLNIGDYVVWSGNTTPSIYVKEGAFTKSALYRYVGIDKPYFWEHDDTTEHVQIALSSILETQNANLQTDNEKAYDFINNLAANNVFANKLTANDIVTERIKAKEGFFDDIHVKNANLQDVYVSTGLRYGRYVTATEASGSIGSFVRDLYSLFNEFKYIQNELRYYLCGGSFNFFIKNGQNIVETVRFSPMTIRLNWDDTTPPYHILNYYVIDGIGYGVKSDGSYVLYSTIGGAFNVNYFDLQRVTFSGLDTKRLSDADIVIGSFDFHI